MVGSLINNGLEFICQKADVANLRYNPRICLVNLRKASEAVQDTPPPVRNLNPEPPKHQQEF